MTTAAQSSEELLTSRQAAILVCSVFLIAICSIVYELLISALSSYFLGSSVTHFSLTIGIFMFFMGVGSYLSGFCKERVLSTFILIEIVIGLLGGVSSFILYAAFSTSEFYYLVATLLIATISILIGLEIPLVTRLVEPQQSLRSSLAKILAFDYLGALIAAILFPFVLLPYFGILKTSFIIGFLNLTVAAFLLREFWPRLAQVRVKLLSLLFISCALLVTGLTYSFQITSFFEKFIYQDQIIFAEDSPYQRIVVTRYDDDIRLFLNGSLQFCSLDEYRYHEPLVHPALSLSRNPEHVLVLGGGDGMAVREVLKDRRVSKVTLVDLDPVMTSLASEHQLFLELNQDSLSDPRVTVLNDDAFTFLKQAKELYSVVIMDFPDPASPVLGKLYSTEFFGLVEQHLAADGIVVTQSGSPYFAREAFWSIHRTLEEVFPKVLPYQVYVPSFGQWGFNIAARRPVKFEALNLPQDLRYLSSEVLPGMVVMAADIAELPVTVNRLDNQALTKYYQQSLERWD